MHIKYRNIVISGGIGTGKTTLAKNLASKLGWKFVSSGEYFRNWYKEHNYSVDQIDKLPDEVDREADAGFEKLIENDSNVVFESQLGSYLARNSQNTYKVLCIAKLDESMRRAASREGISLEDAVKVSSERTNNLDERYKRLYDVEDRFDPKLFDLVVNTTSLSPEEVMNQVLEKIKEE
jgi:CMP/dCMP kinase